MSNCTIKSVRTMLHLRGGLSNGSIKKNRGFTLLEAMIGFLILSIGLLGIASLQATALKSGKSSVYNSVAMMKVEELLESMRANSSALANYAGTGAGENKSCSTQDCSVEELALDDLHWWSENLKAGLPGNAKVLISVAAVGGVSKMETVTVDISWDERNKDKAGPASVNRNFTTTTTICAAIPC